MEQTKPSQSLPDNAYRELKPGEEYVPMMPADAKPKEVTPYSVTMGLLMAVLFSAAAAYLGLRIGQVFEAAIPIAIIAVGVGNMLGKKNMLGQNVIIQSIGASSGIIVAGAIFTLPALYILGLETAFYKVFLSSGRAWAKASALSADIWMSLSPLTIRTGCFTCRITSRGSYCIHEIR